MEATTIETHRENDIDRARKALELAATVNSGEMAARYIEIARCHIDLARLTSVFPA